VFVADNVVDINEYADGMVAHGYNEHVAREAFPYIAVVGPIHPGHTSTFYDSQDPGPPSCVSVCTHRVCRTRRASRSRH
jgi:hypothetical protein